MAGLSRDWTSPYKLVNGTPLVEYGSFSARNPVTTAQYGLANYSLWHRYHELRRWRAAKRAADWLLRTQTRDGAWPYRFDHTAPGGGRLRAGWTSALAQGQALSLLGRLYRHTRDRSYLLAIRRGLRPLRRHVNRGGVARWHHGGLYFEEYSTARPDFVLNGHAQALLGLYDVDDLAPAARSLFRRGVRTLVGALPEFDGGDVSLYSLSHRVAPPAAYNEPIRVQLRALARITGETRITRYAAKWSRP